MWCKLARGVESKKGTKSRAGCTNIGLGMKNSIYWTIRASEDCSESFMGMSDVLIRMQLIILLLGPTCIQTIVFEPRSLMKSWQPVTSDEIFMALDLIMLMAMVQQRTLKCCCSRVAFLEILIFPQDRFELIA